MMHHEQGKDVIHEPSKSRKPPSKSGRRKVELFETEQWGIRKVGNL